MQFLIMKFLKFSCIACDSDLFSEYKPTLYESEIASIKQAMCERYIGVEGYEDIISPGGQCLPGIQRFLLRQMENFSL